ncbi:50S ribosomal protein L10 [Abyssisolibacter fermentans]|uniref:50S ribosomal protein L10 n=1 Tax=Abyssisolibacter fermentans TaxID=1766203 RepID=UPI00082F28C8|nr:50S ribosomal protein L10 [Abyssisolibacter fermentans]
MSEAIREQKKQVVMEIQNKIEKAQAIVLVDYRGLNVEEVTELRKKFTEADVEYRVYKNSMMRFAFKNSGLEEFNQYLTGPNAIAFSDSDPVAPAKITDEFAKKHENLEIKAGVVDGEIIDLNKVKELAALPPREVLIAQVLGGLNAPISGFANVLQGTIRNLVYALDQVKEQKEA